MTHGHVLKRCRSDRVEAVELESGRDWRHITRTQVVEGSSVTVKLFPGSSWNGRSLSTISQKRAVKRMQSTPRRFGRVERPFGHRHVVLESSLKSCPSERGGWRCIRTHPERSVPRASKIYARSCNKDVLAKVAKEMALASSRADFHDPGNGSAVRLPLRARVYMVTAERHAKNPLSTCCRAKHPKI